MKKILSYIGALSLIITSFILSEQTALVVKETDEIMTKIKQEYKKYEQNPINAKIENNTIIPGKYGRKVDINKTYEKMKQIGKYDEKNYIYKEQKPEISIEDNLDKYITSGNKNNNQISIILIIKNKIEIKKIIKTLEITNTKVTFFINNTYLKENKNLTQTMIENGHNIGILSTNDEYEKKEIIEMTKKLKTMIQQKNNYCYTEKEIEKNKKLCREQKNYTIKPSIITKKNSLQQIKKQITSGSIISIDTQYLTEEELELIIKYIKAKGYTIENIEKMIDEKNNQRL